MRPTATKKAHITNIICEDSIKDKQKQIFNSHFYKLNKYIPLKIFFAMFLMEI